MSVAITPSRSRVSTFKETLHTRCWYIVDIKIHAKTLSIIHEVSGGWSLDLHAANAMTILTLLCSSMVQATGCCSCGRAVCGVHEVNAELRSSRTRGYGFCAIGSAKVGKISWIHQVLCVASIEMSYSDPWGEAWRSSHIRHSLR